MFVQNLLTGFSVLTMVLLFTGMIMIMSSCRKERYTQTTTDDVNIAGYLKKHPDQFSLMEQIIKRAGAAGYLNAYGNYTFFIPTNDAVSSWLKSLGKSSVEDVSIDDLKNLVRFHLLADTISTGKFTDGKLAQITFYGQYLQTGIAFNSILCGFRF